MKTLDEVITEMEGCGFIGTGADALQYLKEFRVVTDICHKHGIASLWGQVLPDAIKTNWNAIPNFDNAFNNTPLTWDEIKQMIGKPVWIETTTGIRSGWYLVTCNISDDEAFFTDVKRCEGIGRREDHGTKWQAYRREK